MNANQFEISSDKLKTTLVNDLKGTNNYIIGEILKLAKKLGKIPSLDNQELKDMIQAQLYSENTKAINLPSTEASIRKKINSRIENGESAELYSEMDGIIKENRKYLMETFENHESITSVISKKFFSNIMLSGIVVFKPDGSSIYADEKNQIIGRLIKDNNPISAKILNLILEKPEQEKIFNDLVSNNFNKYFTTQDINNKDIYIYHAEKLSDENIKKFNQKLSEDFLKEILIKEILDKSIKDSGAMDRSEKIIKLLKPSLLKLNLEILSGTSFKDNLESVITNELKKHTYNKIFSLKERTITTNNLNNIVSNIELIGKKELERKSIEKQVALLAELMVVSPETKNKGRKPLFDDESIKVENKKIENLEKKEDKKSEKEQLKDYYHGIDITNVFKKIKKVISNNLNSDKQTKPSKGKQTIR